MNTRSFRVRLALWFSLLSLFTLISAGLYAGWLTASQMKITAGQAVHAQAVAAAELVGANLRERELEILLLSQAPHFTRGDLTHPDLLTSLEQHRLLRHEFAWLGVADLNGTVIQASNNMLVGQSVAQRPWFIAGLQAPYTGDVHEALLLEKLLPKTQQDEPLRFIDFAAPLRDSTGKVIGVVAAHAHWDWVTETVQNVAQRYHTQNKSEILLISKTGHVLYPKALAGQQKLPAHLTNTASHRLKQIPNDKSTNKQLLYAITHWGDKQDYLMSQVVVDTHTTTPLDWRILVRQPLETALAPVYELYIQLSLLALIAVLLFALLAWRLAQSISKPIEQLAAVARAINLNNRTPEYPARSSLKEVNELADAMRSMTGALFARESELAQLNQTLEQQVAQRTQALAEANQQLELLATHDSLTGLYNRRRFTSEMEQLTGLAKRNERGFALLLIDVDYFKKVNDNHGHPQGDAVLQRLAKVISNNTRSTDFVARYGGEEFVVVLPDAPTPSEVQLIAEKIRTAVTHENFSGIGTITISIGTSHWHPTDTQMTAIIQRADQALYRAKAQGRNCVVSYETTNL